MSDGTVEYGSKFEAGGAGTYVSVIETKFADIGHTKDTEAPPKIKNAKDKAAWEFFLSGTLRKLAETRYERAKNKCKSLGLIVKDGDPVKPGSESVTYDSQVITITLNVGKPAERIDPVKLTQELIAAGVDSALVMQAVSKSMTTNTPAKTYRAVPK